MKGNMFRVVLPECPKYAATYINDHPITVLRPRAAGHPTGMQAAAGYSCSSPSMEASQECLRASVAWNCGREAESLEVHRMPTQGFY